MNKARILVVEDDSHLLEGVKTVLELDGYHVLTADNGEKALHLLHEQSRLPDLIVSDIMMPHMDGIQLLKEVRKEPSWVGIPFIFLTARSEKSDVQRGKQLGVDDYLIKPFDADDLLIAVESRLQRQRALNAVHQAEMSDLKHRILTILNHEFRTPLTFVVAYADLLNTHGSSLSNEDILNFLKGVNTGAVRLRRLIENFILLVEMETGDARATYEMRRAPISDVRMILDRAYTQVFVNGNGTAHACTIEVEGEIPVFVADGEFLSIALTHLLDNAVKFSPPDKPITLGARALNNELHLWVSDAGRGIPPEELANIWSSFYQINRAVHEDQGAGSGLPIVRGIAQLHGGRVEVMSQPNVGSTFTLILPIISQYIPVE